MIPLVAVTTLLVGYVYQQVGILELSYRLNEKETLVGKLSEEYRNLEYRVASLQSPSRLEEHLIRSHINMVPPHDVVMIKRVAHPVQPLTLASNTSPFGSLFDWKHWIGIEHEAQAKTLDTPPAATPVSRHRVDG